MRKLLLAFAVIAPLTLAQAAVVIPPTIIRATIDSVKGDRVEVTERDGAKKTLTLVAETRVAEISRIDFTAIKPGSFIGTAAAPGPDGTLRALEVHVFPEAMRGTGEGHRPWEGGADTTMTNGTVGTVDGTSGRTITVRYNGGQQKVTVPDDVPVVIIAPADRTLLKAGAHIVGFTTRGPDGKLLARQISVGKDGLTPPM